MNFGSTPQTLQDVLDRHRRALGGLDALRAAAIRESSCRLQGANAQEQLILEDELTGRIVARIRIPSLGLDAVQGFDGVQAWESSPVYDGYYAPDHPQSRKLALRLGPLWLEGVEQGASGGSYRGAGARLLGLAGDGHGRPCFVIERQAPTEGGRLVPVHHYLDAGSGLLLEDRRGSDAHEVERYDDWREVGGRLVPFRQESLSQEEGDHVLVTQSCRVVAPGDAEFRHPTCSAPSGAGRDEEPDVASLRVVWETIEKVHFDPTFGGVEWASVLARYLPRVGGAAEPGGRGFVDAATEMMAELASTHYSVRLRSRVKSGEAGERPVGHFGLTMGWVEGSATVVRVDPGSPAAAAGEPAPGTRVIAVNGLDDAALAEKHAAARGHVPNSEGRRIAPYELELHAQDGDAVTLTCRDGAGRDRDVVLIARPRPPQRDHGFHARLAGDVLVTGFRLFVGDVAERYADALRASPQARALVIDLRGNPGGLAQLPGAIASLLMREPATLGRMIYRATSSTFAVDGGPGAFAGPVAILVDARSASCSEVLSGALQELGRARLFGRRSAGAVLPATQLLLPNGCAFNFPVCDYLTPGHRRLEGVGVAPDEEVTLRRDDLEVGRDRDLEAALGWLAS